MKKKFALSADQIRPLATGRGSCLASDKKTVEGRPVGYMYREASDDERDSGWRFFAGDEDEAYTSNAANFGVYDVNTIANYDPEITPYLDAPRGSKFWRTITGNSRGSPDDIRSIAVGLANA